MKLQNPKVFSFVLLLVMAYAFGSILPIFAFDFNDLVDRCVLVSMEEGKLHELTQTHNVMPTAAVYSLLRTNGNSIGEVKCRLANATCPEKGSKMCVLKHLEGRVSLQVELLDLGWYKLTIHEADCEWFYGANKCTCPVKS